MVDKVIPDVTLAYADPSLLQCWKEKVVLGVECSLMLKHSKGRTTTTLKCTSRIPEARVPSSDQPLPPKLFHAEKKLRKKGRKKNNLEALLSFQERLVREKGLPPSRLMLEYAASKTSISPDKTDLEDDSNSFKCEECDFTANSENLIGIHKEQHKTDVLMEANNYNSSNGSHNLESGEVPPTKFTCQSCLKTFPTEHSLSLHIYEIPMRGSCFPRKWEGSDVNCRICEHVSSSCAAMVEHVEEKHHRTCSIIPNLKEHYSGCWFPDSDTCNSLCFKMSKLT